MVGLRAKLKKSSWSGQPDVVKGSRRGPLKSSRLFWKTDLYTFSLVVYKAKIKTEIK